MVSISTIGNDKINTLIDVIKQLNDADRRQLVERINATSVADMKAAKEKKRLKAIRAAADDPARAVAFKSSLRTLARLGLELEDLAAAADPLAQINESMSKAGFTTYERMQTKSCLHAIGCLD